MSADHLPFRDGLQALGVSLFYAQPPLAPVHVPLRPGLHVLYGLNGVGKSQVLRLVESALGGRTSGYRAGLQLRLAPGFSLASYALAELAEGITRRLGLSTDDLDAGPSRDADAGYAQHVDAALRALGLPPELAAEVTAQRRVVLTRRDDRYVASVAVQFDQAALLSKTLAAFPEPHSWVGEDLYRPSDDGSPFSDRDERRVQLPITADSFVPDLSDDLGILIEALLDPDEGTTRGIPAWLVERVGPLVAPGVTASEITAQLIAEMERSPLPDAFSWEAYELPFDPWTGLRFRSAWHSNARQSPPGWVAWPVLELGELTGPAWHVDRIGAVTEGTDVLQMLDAAVSRLALPSLLVGNDQTVVAHPQLRELFDQVGARATELARRCVPDTPALHCLPELPTHVSGGQLARLCAGDPVGDALVDLASLSDAQRRWCETGLRMALVEELSTRPAQRWPTGGDTDAAAGIGVVLLDEPDASLHPSAKRCVPAGLAELADTGDVAVLVASHASEFLAHPAAHLLHVLRASGDGQHLATVRAITAGVLTDTPDLESVGLTPATVLQLTRLFLVVEGEHDQAVVRGWLPTLLPELDVRILLLHGDYNLLSLLDSQLLWDASDAAVMVWLDHSTHVNQLVKDWQQIRDLPLFKQGEIPGRLAAAHKLLPERRRGEELSTAHLVHALMEQATRRGLQHRLDIAAHSQHDVIHLLPISAFPGAGRNWQEFENSKQGPDCKKELKRLTGEKVDPADLQRAARACEPHPEVVELGHRMRALREEQSRP